MRRSPASTRKPTVLMTPTVFYDATQAIDDPDHAEPVDRMFASSLARDPNASIQMVRLRPRGFSPVSATQALTRLSQTDPRRGDDSSFAAVREWILSPTSTPAAAPRIRRPQRAPSALWGRHAIEAPRGSVFLKIGSRGWDDAHLTTLLENRPDINVVAALRAEWESDFPEYVPAYEAEATSRAWAALRRRANSVVSLTSSNSDKESRGRIWLTPSALAGSTPTEIDPELGKAPFLVCAGPIEARANILLLLQIWRDIVHAEEQVPKLVLVGRRGAQIDSIAPMLDWAEAIRPHVYETADIGADGLRRLLVHARALLAPDFTAPDDALLRDCCALGTKALAADIPVFRGVGGPLIERLDPLAGPTWRNAIMRTAQAAPRRTADTIALPDWSEWRREFVSYLTKL
jgi:hypothetical protein